MIQTSFFSKPGMGTNMWDKVDDSFGTEMWVCPLSTLICAQYVGVTAVCSQYNRAEPKSWTCLQSLNTKFQSNASITKRLGSCNGIPPNGTLKTGLSGVPEEAQGKELILLRSVPPGLCCRNLDPCCVQQWGALLSSRQLCLSPSLTSLCSSHRFLRRCGSWKHQRG